MSRFSVCAVFYGDYLPLAERLLSSLQHHSHIQDVRLGLNAVSNATLTYIHRWAGNQQRDQPVFLFEPEGRKNVGKYPLMRQMLRYESPADRVMWFDDDSYLSEQAGPDWWDAAVTVSSQATLVGVPHVITQRGKQHEVIVRQPWYTGKPVHPHYRYSFATGGWWIADTQFLLKWDYPFPALYHNGGDSILGELVRQQGRKITSFPGRTVCHCESCRGRNPGGSDSVVHINVGGRKGRRGIGVTGEKYVWQDGNVSPDLSHQEFDLRVYRYEY